MKGIKAKIIDFNSLEFEKEIDIDFGNEIMKPINSYLKEIIDKSGVLIILKCCEIFDSNKLQNFILNKSFPDYIIENHEGDKFGVPDFKLINKNDSNDCFWVEVKTNEDGLRFIQLDWIVDAIKRGEKVNLLIIKSNFFYDDCILSWDGNSFESIKEFKENIKKYNSANYYKEQSKTSNLEDIKQLDKKYY